jgi:hypothetical protein
VVSQNIENIKTNKIQDEGSRKIKLSLKNTNTALSNQILMPHLELFAAPKKNPSASIIKFHQSR